MVKAAAKNGWIDGIKAGANVIMLNLSPPSAKDKYRIYDGKNVLPDSARQSLYSTVKNLEKEGFTADMSKGDHTDWKRKNNHE